MGEEGETQSGIETSGQNKRECEGGSVGEKGRDT